MTRKESGFQSAMPRNLIPVPSATVLNSALHGLAVNAFFG